MWRQPVRLVASAWGRRHLDDLLDFALPAALAPGNLPALASTFDCSTVIVTEEKLFDYVRSHPTIKALEKICTVQLIPLDDLISERWQYGMTLAYALFRGFAELGPAMTETYILFLNADFILADGSYARLVDRIRRGERIHLSPSYCVVEEELKPELRRQRNQNNGVLSVSHRDMAAMILKKIHGTVRAKIVNQDLFGFEHTDQFYWQVNPDTLIGHQMPIALVGMRPERQLTDLNTFWDWGIVYEFCPSKQLNIIGDSDEFLIMELRPKKRSMDSIMLGRSLPKDIARRTKGYITEYQINNAKFELTLRSCDLPLGLAEARQSLRDHVDKVLGHLKSDPIDHRNHSQWAYHRRHFFRRADRRLISNRQQKAMAELQRKQDELQRTRSMIGKMVRPDSGKPADSFQDIDSSLAVMLQSLRQDIERPDVRPSLSGSLARFYHWLTLISYPYRASRHCLKNLVGPIARRQPLRILALCNPDSFLIRMLEEIPGPHLQVSPRLAIDGALNLLPRGMPKFNVCLFELADPESACAARLLNAAVEQLSDDAKIFVRWHDRSGISLRSVQTEIVEFVLDRAHTKAHFTGSWASTWATALFNRLQHLHVPKPLKFGMMGCALIATAPLVAFAEIRGQLRKRPVATSPRYCNSIVVEIDLSVGTDFAPVESPNLLSLDLAYRRNVARIKGPKFGTEEERRGDRIGGLF